jgi:hypothetical protein
METRIQKLIEDKFTTDGLFKEIRSWNPKVLHPHALTDTAEGHLLRPHHKQHFSVSKILYNPSTGFFPA